MRDLNKEYIKALADIVIPPGKNGEPSGSQSRVEEYILSVLQTQEKPKAVYEYMQMISSLAELNESVLKEEEQKNPSLFSDMVELIYEAYYGDPAIVEKLDLPRPPQPGGHRMKAFDVRLLEPVINQK